LSEQLDQAVDELFEHQSTHVFFHRWMTVFCPVMRKAWKPAWFFFNSHRTFFSRCHPERTNTALHRLNHVKRQATVLLTSLNVIPMHWKGRRHGAEDELHPAIGIN
jgi:hypothetical protein